MNFIILKGRTINTFLTINRLKKLEFPLDNFYGSPNNVCFVRRHAELEAYLLGFRVCVTKAQI